MIFRGGHGSGLIVIEKSLFIVCAPAAQLSIARTVKLNVPAVVGVPEINPDELRFKPEGSDPPTTLNVIGACPPDVFN